MLSLSERLEQINKLRKQALSNPDFVTSASAHAKAIEQQAIPILKQRKKVTKKKTFADVYHQTNFSTSPVGAQH